AFLLACSSSGQAGGGQAAPTAAVKAQIRAILSETAFWGKDAPSALLQLPAWRRAGETSIQVFPDFVLGAASYPNEAAARAAGRVLNAGMKAAPQRPNPEGTRILQNASRKWGADAEVQTIPYFFEDETVKIVA